MADFPGENRGPTLVSLNDFSAQQSSEMRRLRHLIPATDAEIADRSVEGQQRLLTRLRRAIRAERQRGIAGHWSYDLNRHIALKQAVDLLQQRHGLQLRPDPDLSSRKTIAKEKTPAACHGRFDDDLVLSNWRSDVST
ncbi:hypothetical protein [Amorphus sp. 3PC139-8]|uniref:hypothetical protein n=1 Tax=Amorphus sp. 3PC139-8 TaxID=2735676 RepID=UPI00345C6580